MIFRLILLALAVLLGLFGLKHLLKPGGSFTLGELSGGEREALEALSRRSDPMKKALDVRAKVHEILRDGGPSESSTVLARQVDEALKQLSRQTTTLERVIAALDPRTLDAHVERERELNQKLDATIDVEERQALRQTLARLEQQQAQLAQLRTRKGQLEAAGTQLVLDLQNLHLALLDAASSRAGLGSDAVRSLADKLQTATREVATQAQAEEEIARALAQVEA